MFLGSRDRIPITGWTAEIIQELDQAAAYVGYFMYYLHTFYFKV